MKKICLLLLAILHTEISFAENIARIKIKIAGDAKGNKYFLCIHHIGCLSILAAQRGKTYTILHSVEMDKIYALNSNNFHILNQGLPSSCDHTIDNKTITISGKIIDKSDDVKISNLKCSID